MSWRSLPDRELRPKHLKALDVAVVRMIAVHVVTTDHIPGVFLKVDLG